MFSSPAFADWQVTKNSDFIGGYSVSDSDTNRALGTKFNTEKGARAAAKAMNKADKLAKKNAEE